MFVLCQSDLLRQHQAIRTDFDRKCMNQRIKSELARLARRHHACVKSILREAEMHAARLKDHMWSVVDSKASLLAGALHTAVHRGKKPLSRERAILCLFMTLVIIRDFGEVVNHRSLAEGVTHFQVLLAAQRRKERGTLIGDMQKKSILDVARPTVFMNMINEREKNVKDAGGPK